MKTLVEYDHVRDTPDLSATSIKLHKLGFNGLIVDADFLSDPDAVVVAKHLGLPIVAVSIPLEILSQRIGDYSEAMRALGVFTLITSWEATPADGGLSSLTAAEACLRAQGLRLAWHSRNIDLNTRNWRETIAPLLSSIPNLDWIADLKGNVPEELERLRAMHTRAVGVRLPDLDYGPRGVSEGYSPGCWKTLLAELAVFPRLTFVIAAPKAEKDTIQSLARWRISYERLSSLRSDALFEGVTHIAIKIMDLDRSLDFYCNVMGFTEMFRLDAPGRKPFLVYLRINDRQYIELFPGAVGDQTATPEARGYQHLCLEVTDLDATVDTLMQRGAQMYKWRSDNSALDACTGTGIILGLDHNRQAWVQDPDGNRIEIMEMAYRSLQYGSVTEIRLRAPGK